MSQSHNKNDKSSWEKASWGSWLAGWIFSPWGCVILLLAIAIGAAVFSALFPH